MSIVENHSLEPNPKRRQTDLETRDSWSSNCLHWFARYGVCCACKSTVEKSHGKSIDYLDEGIQMSHEALAFTKRVITQLSCFNKKLHLVLDLDHTLIHTIRVSMISESDNYMIEEAASRKDLWRRSNFPNEILIKLRPFVHEFLVEANEMFSMYVYTKGCPEYAKLVLDLIDPERKYFEDRVITRRESPDTKTLDLVLADERGIVIVDDNRDVWPHHKKNLLQIMKYTYFRKNKKRDDSEINIRDESEIDGPLVSVLRFLKEVHQGFFKGEDIDSKDVRLLLEENSSSRAKRS